MEYSVLNIIEKLPANEVIGDKRTVVTKVVGAAPGAGTENSILWISDKNADLFKTIESGVVICSQTVPRRDFKPGCTYLIVENPRRYFAEVVRAFFYEHDQPQISQKAIVDSTVRLGINVTIRAGAIVEKNCVIGDNSSIDSNTVIKKGTVIGQRVKIGANTTIGGDGFGYEKNEAGEFDFIPHIGNVLIEDDAEIGNNTTIDRAVLGSTVIGRNAKIDNLVHIAHGVVVGENSLVIANAMVAGSTIIGKNVWVAPSASILNKLKVGDNALVGMGAVVVRNVEPFQTIVGNPGKDIRSLKKNP